MKLSRLICCLALVSGAALAQQSADVRGGSSSSSTTSPSNTSGPTNRPSAPGNRETVAAEVADHAATLAQGMEIDATLSRTIDTRKANPGDAVTATVAQDVHVNGHVALPRGTKLLGHVTEAQSRHGGSADPRLGIVFDRAVVSEGHEMPMNATLRAVASAEAAAATTSRAAAEAKPNGSRQPNGVPDSPGSAAGGLLANVASSPGAPVDTATGLAGGVAGVAGSNMLGAASVSAGAVGGFGAAGRLTSGSSGVFGFPGVEMVNAKADGAEGHGSALTAHTRYIVLTRGTQLLLVTAHGSSSDRKDADIGTSGPASDNAAISRDASVAATGND